VKLNIPQLAKTAKKTLGRYSPEILTGIGITGMITTTVMAVKATPKALALIDQQEYDEKTGTWGKLTKLEKFKAAWTCYVPAGVTGCLSIACLVGASSVNAQRNAAIAAAYALSESALKEYQDKVIETIGEKKENAIRDDIAKDKITRNPPANNEIYITEKGQTLCYDVISGRYFKSDANIVKRAENTLNKQLRRDDYVSLNDFYYEIGLPDTRMGGELGWSSSNGDIEFKFSPQLAENDTPCLVIDFHVAPRYDYQKY
jgi:hypothetical protein